MERYCNCDLCAKLRLGLHHDKNRTHAPELEKTGAKMMDNTWPTSIPREGYFFAFWKYDGQWWSEKLEWINGELYCWEHVKDGDIDPVKVIAPAYKEAWANGVYFMKNPLQGVING